MHIRLTPKTVRVKGFLIHQMNISPDCLSSSIGKTIQIRVGFVTVVRAGNGVGAVIHEIAEALKRLTARLAVTDATAFFPEWYVLPLMYLH